jgi:hypothetical protein
MVHLSALHISVQQIHLSPFEPVHTFLTVCASLADCTNSSEHLCTWQLCVHQSIFCTYWSYLFLPCILSSRAPGHLGHLCSWQLCTPEHFLHIVIFFLFLPVILSSRAPEHLGHLCIWNLGHLCIWHLGHLCIWHLGTCAFGTWGTCAFGTWAPVHLANDIW